MLNISGNQNWHLCPSIACNYHVLDFSSRIKQDTSASVKDSLADL